MLRDFNIRNGIHLVQPPYELDLHNLYDFIGLHYSVEHRTLLLCWRRAQGEWIASDAPTAVSIEFQEVSEFRFLPDGVWIGDAVAYRAAVRGWETSVKARNSIGFRVARSQP